MTPSKTPGFFNLFLSLSCFFYCRGQYHKMITRAAPPDQNKVMKYRLRINRGVCKLAHINPTILIMKHLPPIHFKIPFTLFIFIFSLAGLSAQQEKVKTPGEWTVVDSYEIPGKASGLAWDGELLYFGIYGTTGNHVYKFDPATGNFELQCINTDMNDAYGMTSDGNHLWITDHGLSGSVPAYALQFDYLGNTLQEFDLPDHYMSGIAYDDGDFWVCTYYPDPGTVYKVDNTGAILSQFTAPDEQPWDICLEGEYLWVADYNASMLYKTDTLGTVLESHGSENVKPAGIVFDGTYLWYVDGPLSAPSTLYKVDPYGIGTPVIEVPVTSYDFGLVTLNDSASWECLVWNTGSTTLEISNIQIQNAVPIFINEALPITIEEGQSHAISFKFKPTEQGSLYTTATLQSNDPVTPLVDILLEGEALYEGPHILLNATAHDYGTVRLNAHTRWFLEVTNYGNTVLEINDIEMGSPVFYTDPMLSFPLEVGILETTSIGIWFSPDAFGPLTDMATVFSNDVSQPAPEISLSGDCEDLEYPIGYDFWGYTVNTSWDNSIKAITPLQDITGDGIKEVIVCSEDDFIRCFNGNASGTGDVLWEQDAGSVYGQNGITVIEDVNGDGLEDVVAGLAWGTRAVKVFSGKTGELLWIYDTHVYGDGGWVYQVSTGFDYNEDGTDDVLASTGNDGNNAGPKRIFCLDGVTGDVIWDCPTNGPNFACMGIADFTGDGHPDVLGGSSNNNETSGKVYGIDGSDGSLVWTHTAAGTSVWALEQLDDITGDGVKDVIAGDFGGQYYLLDAVDGSVQNAGMAGSSIFLRFERLDDVNQNGYADIAFAYSGTNAIVIDGSDGSPIWFSSLADKCWNIDRVEDITGDGINDLFAGTLFSNNHCYFLDGASGDALYSFNFMEPVDAIAAIPDINNDGSWEMVAGGRNGKLKCYSSGEVPAALQAAFTADVTAGPSPLQVQFTDLSAGNPTDWEWDFENDGITDSYDQHPQHTFLNSGLYSVKLTISDDQSSNTVVQENYIQVDTTVHIAQQAKKMWLSASPNPFQNGTEIILYSAGEEMAEIEILNLSGEVICTRLPISKTAGYQKFNWDGRHDSGTALPAGIYLARIRHKGSTATLKLLLR